MTGSGREKWAKTDGCLKVLSWFNVPVNIRFWLIRGRRGYAAIAMSVVSSYNWFTGPMKERRSVKFAGLRKYQDGTDSVFACRDANGREVIATELIANLFFLRVTPYSRDLLSNWFVPCKCVRR